MPVKKKKATSSPIAEERVVQIGNTKESSIFLLSEHGKKFMWTLVGIFLVYAIVFVATIIRNNLESFYYIGQTEAQSKTIVVSGTATVSLKPDIAMTSIGTISSGDTVKEAQEANTEIMNNVIAELETLGIEDKDIQTTQYNLYPRYDYVDGARVSNGYEVSQTVSVKIRDLSKANDVVAIAGKTGANSVGGLQFTIDDPDSFTQIAREEAILKAKRKALDLSSTLGIRLGDVIGYNEYTGGNDVPYYREMAVGFGGGGSADIQPGENTKQFTVNLTYQIK